jgi:hypothetical protein
MFESLLSATTFEMGKEIIRTLWGVYNLLTLLKWGATPCQIAKNL